MNSISFLTAGLCAAALTYGIANAATDPQGCKRGPVDIGREGQAIHLYHLFSGPDGKSHLDTVAIEGKDSAFFAGAGNPAIFTQFKLGAPSNVVIVRGPPNVQLPTHPAPYREIFLTVSGSTVMMLPDGTKQELGPGDMLLTEDVTGTTGHSGLTGPCGYVAVDFQFKTPAADAK